ncbi:ABC-three component system middle component 7 [Cohnella yongneupensis]|uniref:ABC-three component system middle component 7 n=1 Tax=Cohnella yongneupensis TaxID=425006 RepID=A0ABW0R7D2_9BACL
MKFPNKLYSYNESIISKFPIILNAIENHSDSTILDLYSSVSSKFQNTSEFLDALDCLYALGKIEYSFDPGRVHNVI